MSQSAHSKEEDRHEHESIDVVLDVQGLLESVSDLRLDQPHHKDQQVAGCVVEDEVGRESLGEGVDQRQPVKGIEEEELPCLFDLSGLRVTFSFCRQSKRMAVPMMMT